MLLFIGFHLLSAITRKFQDVPDGCFFCGLWGFLIVFFLLFLGFFLVCVWFCWIFLGWVFFWPRLLAWHSSLKFHFEKEGQESWKLWAPSSRLGGGGGGNECGTTKGLLLQTQGLVCLRLSEGPFLCGLSSWACEWPQKHIGQKQGN